MTFPLSELLRPYGARPEGVIELRGAPGPEHVRYLNLRESAQRGLLAPDGVVEILDGPLAYVVDGTEHRLPDRDLGRLCRMLAYRSDAPYLTVVEPGRLTVYGISLKLRPDQNLIFEVPESRSARDTFPRLHLQPPTKRNPERRAVQDVLFRLFTAAIEKLQAEGISQSDAISLAGRAMFTRFLIDREILGGAELAKVCPTASDPELLFSNARRVEDTCSWLDGTFNGDFLPLTTTDFRRLENRAFWHLDNIMRRSPGGQRRFDWAVVDFSYVPVEVLSQVYEWSAERWNPGLRRRQSMYFTPLRIARYMVRRIFAGLEELGPVPPHKARVLDPAVGGGVFLVAAFREIFAACWRQHGRPPDTRKIRSILTSQLAGFDIHEPALRLAALGLYLTAIELDQKPKPVEKLGFAHLQGKVLFNVRHPEELEQALTVGSLERLKGAKSRRYDVVVGNPPWTSLNDGRFRDRGQARVIHRRMIEAIRPIVKRRLGAERSRDFTVPDLVPDLPFVWAAMKWARLDGWLSFALHGRLLFKQSQSGQTSRADLFEALDITGLLNGADLRNTDVWPEVQAPFCLLFARNRKPNHQSAFYFLSPFRETSMNRQGRLRIDAQAAQPVVATSVLSEPCALKALFRGTALDLSVMRKIESSRRLVKLKNYWEDELFLATGVGYQINGDSNDASFLAGYRNLDASCRPGFLINKKSLPRFSHTVLHRPRRREIYLGPLLLVRKSPPSDRQSARAHACMSDLAYTESFYGYSAAGAANAKLLIRYVHLLLHSGIFMWHTLMTSGEFGVERDSIEKSTIDGFPIVPISEIEPSELVPVEALSDEVFACRDVWGDLDEWSGRIYGLDRWDLEVIRDTLAVNLPFARIRGNAERSPSPEQVRAFARRLEQELRPFVMSANLTIDRRVNNEASPWEVLGVHPHGRSAGDGSSIQIPTEVFARADSSGASQIVIPDPEAGCLLVAILRQYRFWTPTRARLLALEILEEHLEDMRLAATTQ